MRFPLQPRHVGAAFGLYFVADILAAMFNALSSTGPWFREVSVWIYVTTFLASLLLLLFFGLVVLLLARPNRSPVVLVPAPTQAPSVAAEGPGESVEDVETLLETLESAVEVGVPPSELESEAEAVSEVPQYGTAPTISEVARRTVRIRRVGLILLGPALVALAFLGTSAALLPGALGYLQTNFRLNTFVILSMAYGWFGLLPYAALSVYLALTEP